MAQALLGAVAGGWTTNWVGSWWTVTSAAGDAWPSLPGQGASTLPWLLLFSAASAAAGGFVLWRASFQDEIDLAWDGHIWRFRCLAPPSAQPLTNEFRPCEVQVAWDFGAALLLRLDSAHGRGGTRRWLMCERSRLGGAWHPLRVAMFASRR